MGSILVLECQSRTLPYSRITLVPGKLVVGRSRNCGLHVPDPTVSRRHAEILVTEQEINVIDLESHNGTYVEDAPVAACRLLPGQCLRFGAVPFRLSCDSGGYPFAESEVETLEAPSGRPENSSDPLLAALSPAQRRVFDLLLSGKSEKEVAARLHLSRNTVHNHIREIYKMADVHSRAELLARFVPAH